MADPPWPCRMLWATQRTATRYQSTSLAMAPLTMVRPCKLYAALHRQDMWSALAALAPWNSCQRVPTCGGQQRFAEVAWRQ